MIERLTLDQIELIDEVLRRGLVVALPTDTVYGVATRLDDGVALARLFALKGRPETVALPVLAASIDQVRALGVEWSEPAVTLAKKFWPGPLTIVLGAPSALARAVGSTSDTLGVRVPDDESLRALLELTGPLAVSSANAHGEPACHDVHEVDAVLGGREGLGAIVDGGRRDGRVSSVVDLSGDTWRVLREGAIGEDQIANTLID